MTTHKSRGVDRDDLNVLVLIRGHERYVWLYRDRHIPQVVRTTGSMAVDPDLSFSWANAAEVCSRLRQSLPPVNDRRRRT